MLKSGFYNMDCMEGMREFPDGFFDLAVVDPPYGIGIGHKAGSMTHLVGGDRPFGGKNHCRRYGSDKPCKTNFYHPFDDSSAPDKGYFTELRRVSKRQIIWGGNFFLDALGSATCMIVWDKKRRGMDQADCEIAWMNLPGQSRIFEYKWNGMLQEDMLHKEQRIHPTQKPVRLYAWLLSRWAKKGDRILDTHVGSASSLIACHRAGLEYWGFEIDPVFYRDAKERLDAERAQMNLFGLLE